MTFGARLKQLRGDKNMKQSELAKKLGVTAATISAYENGTRTPDINMASEIADLFDISVDNLLGKPSKHTIDLKHILTEEALNFDGKEMSDRNIKAIARVVQSFMEEMDD